MEMLQDLLLAATPTHAARWRPPREEMQKVTAG